MLHGCWVGFHALLHVLNYYRLSPLSPISFELKAQKIPMAQSFLTEDYILKDPLVGKLRQSRSVD